MCKLKVALLADAAAERSTEMCLKFKNITKPPTQTLQV